MLSRQALIDPTISFSPVMYNNIFEKTLSTQDKFTKKKHPKIFKYSIFASLKKSNVPGYLGKRCIIEYEMALALKRIQQKLKKMGPYSLKVLDAYRPKQSVDYFAQWALTPDDEVVKNFHYPNITKSGLHNLNYLARVSSHSLGTAVDLTIIVTDSKFRDYSSNQPEDFLGIFNIDELDMGHVGYLAFDQRSSHYTWPLTSKQTKNRKLLQNLMEQEGFKKLNSEFWHYSYKSDRNKDKLYNFPIKDDYNVSKEGIIRFF